MDDLKVAVPVKLAIVSDPAFLPVVRATVGRVAELIGFCCDDSDKIILALDEALANVIRHGYDGRNDGPVELSFERVERDGASGIKIIICDRGKQVDPAKIRSRDLKDIRPGGLGVHIMNTVMNDVSYDCPKEGGMALTMIKYIDRPVERQAKMSGKQSQPAPQQSSPEKFT